MYIIVILALFLFLAEVINILQRILDTFNAVTISAEYQLNIGSISVRQKMRNDI